jgi:hypothetical protein
MTPPKDRSGSRRASSQFTVVCHEDLLKAARAKCEEEGVVLSEVVRDYLATWAKYDGPKVVGRQDRV